MLFFYQFCPPHFNKNGAQHAAPEKINKIDRMQEHCLSVRHRQYLQTVFCTAY